MAYITTKPIQKARWLFKVSLEKKIHLNKAAAKGFPPELSVCSSVKESYFFPPETWIKQSHIGILTKNHPNRMESFAYWQGRGASQFLWQRNIPTMWFWKTLSEAWTLAQYHYYGKKGPDSSEFLLRLFRKIGEIQNTQSFI